MCIRDKVRAIISRKRPVPAAHLSFITKFCTVPCPSIQITFESWPPMSMTCLLYTSQAVETAAASGDGPQLSLWTALWFTGLAACTVFFAASYIRCRRQFRISLPVDNEFTKKWLAAHRLRRRISIRQSECISSPLTYGCLLYTS